MKTPILSNLKFRTREGAAYDIPEGGSLGLLALGYIGLMAWREKRALMHNYSPTTESLEKRNTINTLNFNEEDC